MPKDMTFTDAMYVCIYIYIYIYIVNRDGKSEKETHPEVEENVLLLVSE